jgi:glucokinase
MQKHPLFIGIEIGGTKLQFVKGDAAGRIQHQLRYTINVQNGAKGICRQIERGLQELHSHDAVAIGIGFGGPVDRKTGTIRTSHQVTGWDNCNFVEWIGLQTGLPVVIENDANTAALAEALLGSGKGHETVFYTTIGSGIGGGLIVNGKIYHGCTPGEAEIGHLRLSKKGETLEECCSGWAVDKKVEDLIRKQPDGLMAKLSAVHKGPAARLLKPALDLGDAAARDLIDTVADDLAFALSHVAHLFHPDVLIIGGGLSLLKEHLLLPVTAKLPRYMMPAFLPAPEIMLSQLGEDVVPIGALLLAQTAGEGEPRYSSQPTTYEKLD